MIHFDEYFWDGLVQPPTRPWFSGPTFQLGDCIFVEMDEEKHDQLEVTKSLWELKGALTKFNAVPTDINR